MELSNIKKTVLYGGSVLIGLYILLSLIESTSKIFAVIVLWPLLAWPYLVKKYEADAAIASIAVGCIVIIWFVIDFFILRYYRFYWHVPMFILIAPLPAFLSAWAMWYYSGEKKIKPVLYLRSVKEVKKFKRKVIRKWNAITAIKKKHG